MGELRICDVEWGETGNLIVHLGDIPARTKARVREVFQVPGRMWAEVEFEPID